MHLVGYTLKKINDARSHGCQMCVTLSIYTQSVLFIVSLSTAGSSHREPASIRTFCDRHHAQAYDQIKMYDVEGTCIMHGKQWHIYGNLSQKVRKCNSTWVNKE
jgi:hypothetical protein